ncbi:hypothetical protein C0992_013235 [Termitomyces sp. T32_za158]|nr:hypothetical protein C0992_013235 [Termitomyces sp. T32_za158]
MSLFPVPISPIRIASDPICYDVDPISFYDGNLTVCVGALTFQLHASIFTRQSPHFAKIWHNRPHRSDGKFTLVLREEDPVNFSLLFSVMYGLEPILYGLNPLSVDVVDSLLHLSDWFGISTIYSHLGHRVRTAYSSALSAFDEVHTSTFFVLQNGPGSEFDLLNTCKLFGLQSSVSCILLRICMRYTAVWVEYCLQ